jgi:Abi-like protein
MKINNINSLAVQQARIKALSHARLSSYRRFFTTQSDQETLGLYQWNEDLSAIFFKLIISIEIVLRNQCHGAMSTRYGAIGSGSSRDWYEHIQLTPLSRQKIQEITHIKRRTQWTPRNPFPTPDDVISRLTFGFWPHLLDVGHDSNNYPIAWGNILLDVLPGHRQRQATYWARQKHRDAFFGRLDLCNEMRNRIAHHEPIWKMGPLLEETRARAGSLPAVIAPAPVTPSDALDRLKLIYERLNELLDWLSPEIAADYAQSEMHHKCLSLLSLHILNAYRHAQQPTALNLAHYQNNRTLKKAIRLASRQRQPIVLKDGHRTLGHITCVANTP